MRSRFLWFSAALLLLITSQAPAAESWFQMIPLKSEGPRLLRLAASRAPLSRVLVRLERELDRRVVLDFDTERQVTLLVKRATPDELLRRVAVAAGLTVLKTNSSYILRDASEPTLTIDVKDADVRLIMREVKEQCGIKNMIIDPEVQGTGTFLFDGVPCRLGIRTILASLGLGSEPYPDLLRVTAANP